MRAGQEVDVPQGGPWKKNDESDVHLPQPQKQVGTYLFCRFFLVAFLGVSWQGEFKNTTKASFPKKAPGLITKNVAFFPSVFFPLPRGCFARFF
jgi:hypothetical protein